MAGTKTGGLKTVAKNLAKDPDYYRKLGHKGGKAVQAGPRGFARMTLDQRQAAGKKGGTRSRRMKQSYYDNLKIAEAMAETDDWMNTMDMLEAAKDA